jgi:holo-[acyl-carrier protein] synthase
MIIGHGIDLVEIDRVNNIYAKYKKNFISKYFLNDQFKSINKNLLANNFAIKEAFSKSIGMGFRSPCYPNNIVVSRNELGKPVISLKNKLESYFNDTFGKYVIHVSLTDTKLYSIASVIIEQS